MRRGVLQMMMRGRSGQAAAALRGNAYNCTGALAASRRGTSTTTATVNPVNVEDFTLNEEIVKRHQEIGQRWTTVGEALQSARDASDNAGVVAAAESGLQLLEEVGPMDSPVQCFSNLKMEIAQANFNLRKADAALSAAREAKDFLKASKDCDASKVSEIEEFIGHVHLLAGNAVEGEAVFRQVLSWIDTDARKALPMVSVAAINQRRTVLMGVGLALKCQAEQLEQEGGDGAALYGQALDVLVDALNQHIEANDFGTVKETLQGIVKCFVGVKDGQQAITTCEKYVSWCRRHEDNDGVQHGEALLGEVCTQFKVDNPLLKKGASPTSEPSATTDSKKTDA